MGHPQEATNFYGDNEIAVAISNDGVKVNRARAIEKSYHWFRSKCRDNEFKSNTIKGVKNTSDYFTKALSKIRHLILKPNIVFSPMVEFNNHSKRRNKHQ